MGLQPLVALNQPGYSLPELAQHVLIEGAIVAVVQQVDETTSLLPSHMCLPSMPASDIVASTIESASYVVHVVRSAV